MNVPTDPKVILTEIEYRAYPSMPNVGRDVFVETVECPECGALCCREREMDEDQEPADLIEDADGLRSHYISFHTA